MSLVPEGVRFAGRGLALGELTIEGYSAVIDRTRELAKELRDREGANAIALMGTFAELLPRRRLQRRTCSYDRGRRQAFPRRP